MIAWYLTFPRLALSELPGRARILESVTPQRESLIAWVLEPFTTRFRWVLPTLNAESFLRVGYDVVVDQVRILGGTGRETDCACSEFVLAANEAMDRGRSILPGRSACEEAYFPELGLTLVLLDLCTPEAGRQVRLTIHIENVALIRALISQSTATLARSRSRGRGGRTIDAT